MNRIYFIAFFFILGCQPDRRDIKELTAKYCEYEGVTREYKLVDERYRNASDSVCEAELDLKSKYNDARRLVVYIRLKRSENGWAICGVATGEPGRSEVDYAATPEPYTLARLDELIKEAANTSGGNVVAKLKEAARQQRHSLLAAYDSTVAAANKALELTKTVGKQAGRIPAEIEKIKTEIKTIVDNPNATDDQLRRANELIDTFKVKIKEQDAQARRK